MYYYRSREGIQPAKTKGKAMKHTLTTREAATTYYVVEISDGQPVVPRTVLDTLEVYASSLNDALAQAYMEVDNAYIAQYGPSVAEWMQVRLTNTTTGKRTKWYTLDALGKVEA